MKSLPQAAAAATRVMRYDPLYQRQRALGEDRWVAMRWTSEGMSYRAAPTRELALSLARQQLRHFAGHVPRVTVHRELFIQHPRVAEGGLWVVEGDAEEVLNAV